MSLNILDLIPEIHENIYNHCYRSDLLNLACCNSEYNDALKYILWKNVNLPWSILAKKWKRWIFFDDPIIKNRLENLAYTNFLSFYDDGRVDIESEEQWENICENYKRLLEYCDRERMEILHVEGIIDDDGVKLTCQTLYNLKELSISRCKQSNVNGWQDLSSLTQLEKLCISHTYISDESLQCLSSMDSLRELELNHHCGINSQIFSTMSQKLVELRKLTLSFQKSIHGLAHLGQLENLVELNLKQTGSSDVIPVVCDNLNQLEVLNLSGCSFCADRLRGLTKLKSLKNLDVSGSDNMTFEKLCAIAKVPTLEKLNLGHCYKLDSAGVSQLSDLTCLRVLNLSWCRNVSDDNLEILSHLQHLERLDVSRCSNISDIGCSFIGTIRCLQDVFLNGCVLVSDIGVQALAKLTKLKRLDIGCTGVSDDVLKEFSTLHYLKELDLTFCSNITDLGIAHLGALVTLEKLNISHTKVTDEGLAHLGGLIFLKEFNINACKAVTDEGLLHVAKMTSLESLWIGHNDFTDNGLSKLLKLRSLREFECMHTQITSAGINNLNTCTLLKDIKC